MPRPPSFVPSPPISNQPLPPPACYQPQFQDEARRLGPERMVLVLIPPCQSTHIASEVLLLTPGTSVVISLFAIVILSILGSLFQVRPPARPVHPQLHVNPN